MAIIEVNHLQKNFKIYKRPKGTLNAVKSLFVRNYEIKEAVRDVSFSIEPGEMVGYIGANGAGKSTTIKMLSGILVPTSGTVSVNGILPYRNRKENAQNIGIVFGQRSQLNWDLPMEDTFQLYKQMYHIDDKTFQKNVSMFTELLAMESFLRKPVRQLSLGQKMRAELAIAMLHNPQILYLDEPTIGLDVLVKDHIRTFIRELNKEQHTTVILTTHDMKDIDTICDRVIFIDKGVVLADSSLEKFKNSHSESYFIRILYEHQKQPVNYPGVVCVAEKEHDVTYQVDKRAMSVNAFLQILLDSFEIRDIEIHQEGIEEIVKKLYTK